MGAQLGFEVIETERSHIQSAADGTVTNVLTAPGNLPTGGSLPQAVAAQSNLGLMTFDVLSLTLGDAGAGADVMVVLTGRSKCVAANDSEERMAA